MQVIFFNSKGLWSAAGVPLAGRACTGESSSKQWDLLQAPLKCKPPKIKGNSSESEPRPQRTREPGEQRPPNTHTAELGTRDLGITVQHHRTSSLLIACNTAGWWVQKLPRLRLTCSEIKYYCPQTFSKLIFSPLSCQVSHPFNPLPFWKECKEGQAPWLPNSLVESNTQVLLPAK